MDGRVRWMIKEAYPDARKHGVPDSTRTKRRRHMEQYLFHMADLAAAAPKEATAAKEFLRDTYMTLGNATWKASGTDRQLPQAGTAGRMFPAEDMLHFLSEQVYAMRYYADAHPKFGPAGRLGFSWQPTQPAPPSPHDMPAAEFLAGQDLIAARIGSAVRTPTRARTRPRSTPAARRAAGSSGATASFPDATFTNDWLDFAYWK